MPQRALEVRDAVAADRARRDLAASLRLRAASPADVPALEALVNAAYHDSERHVFPGTRRTERDQLLQQLDGVTVAEIGARIVACINVNASRDPAHFAMLAVDPTLHRSGIGSRLIDHAERIAKVAGCRRMQIETVKEAGLVPYYQRRGFRVSGETPGQVWNNGADWGAAIDWHMVDMEKDLR